MALRSLPYPGCVTQDSPGFMRDGQEESPNMNGGTRDARIFTASTATAARGKASISISSNTTTTTVASMPLSHPARTPKPHHTPKRPPAAEASNPTRHFPDSSSYAVRQPPYHTPLRG
ncbi:hypothetical protein FALBO_6690 [Fusarium albosuccineum]|uniref:Uncharacterized protein n=1 Tax=Fusarium albosuccineum TaxID=1237068 RepID=A0A8H4LFA2_9HYPO|nr:hypothetical protein FALBO_6690 [Fusarium albosuccineum]